MLEKVPQTLTNLNQWVLWREVIREGKPTKVPFQTTGAEAKSNDPTTWSDFATARDRLMLGNFAGVGFMFSEGGGIVGVDLDGCRNPGTGMWSPWAREIVERFNTYTEMSPSGTGCKLFLRAAWDRSGMKTHAMNEPAVSEKTPGIEIYGQRRYFAVTGKWLSGTPLDVEPRQEALDWLVAKIEAGRQREPSHRRESPEADAGSIVDRARKYLQRMPFAVSGQRGHDATFRAACVLVLDFDLSSHDAFALLQEWNQGCQPPWSDRDLQRKVDEAGKQPGDRGRLANAQPAEWNRIRIPSRQCPQQPPADSKPAVAVTTAEDSAKRFLESLAAEQPLMTLGLPNLDWALGGGIEAPEMVIFAARPGHGKTAAALQIAWHVSLTDPVLFVSEEMSDLQIGKRAVQFATDINSEQWPARTHGVAADVSTHFSQRKPCYIAENCRTVERVCETIRRHVAEHGVKLAIVDYAQRLGGERMAPNLREQVARTSIALTSVAAECKIPLVVLCQMSRLVEARTKFIPQLSDLKEAGQLEQDASVVVFQVRPSLINSDEPPEKFVFFVEKNRNRPINKRVVECRFLGHRQMLAPELHRTTTGPMGAVFADHTGGSDGDDLF